MEVIFATGNHHKLEEVRQMFPSGTRILSLKDIGFTGDIDEPFETMEENALVKADVLFERFGLPCFSDDSGLEVHALGMRPGVYSARYAGPEKNDTANLYKVLQEMTGQTDRRARFRAVIAYRDSSHRATFEGIVDGTLATAPTGGGGFGYDPIFIPEGYMDSFAALPSEVKGKISHRARAIESLLAQMRLWGIISADQ